VNGADFAAAVAEGRDVSKVPAVTDPSRLEDRQARINEWLAKKGF
jgi:hypothetical protein